MSNRSSIRAIAKARLKAMGVPHVNKILGMNLSCAKARRYNRTRRGRERFEKLRSEHQPLWRRVTTGSLARDGFIAQMDLPGKKKYRVAD